MMNHLPNFAFKFNLSRYNSEDLTAVAAAAAAAAALSALGVEEPSAPGTRPASPENILLRPRTSRRGADATATHSD